MVSFRRNRSTVLLLVTGVISIVLGSGYLNDPRGISKWPHTSGEVEGSSLTPINVKWMPYYSRRYYQAGLTYRYTVDSVEYLGTEISPNGNPEFETSQEVVDFTGEAHQKYEISVYFNPENPSEAFLQVPDKTANWPVAGIGIILLILGVNSWLTRRRKKHAYRLGKDYEEVI